MSSLLLKRKPKIGEAERTLKLANAAWKKGDLRLAVSRAITAVVQAAKSGNIKRADKVVKDARVLLQGAVISKMPGAIEGLWKPSNGDLHIRCSNIEIMIFSLARGGIPFDQIRPVCDGVVVEAGHANKAKAVLRRISGGKYRTILKVS